MRFLQCTVISFHLMYISVFYLQVLQSLYVSRMIYPAVEVTKNLSHTCLLINKPHYYTNFQTKDRQHICIKGCQANISLPAAWSFKIPLSTRPAPNQHDFCCAPEEKLLVEISFHNVHTCHVSIESAFLWVLAIMYLDNMHF